MKRMSKVFAVLAPDADMTALKACYTVTVSKDAVEPCESIIITPTVKINDNKVVVEIIVVNKALEIYPNNKNLNAVVAGIEYQKGNYEKAAKCYEKAEGNPEAVVNAKEVRKVVLNNKYFAKYKRNCM